MEQAKINLEAKMVLFTLEQQPMTIEALERHWRPTWSIVDLEKILRQLLRDGRVRLDKQRYFAMQSATQKTA